VAELKTLVDEVVVLHTSAWFFGIGQFYEQFPQVEDEEVITCLDKIRAALSQSESASA
jgi:predicted phosphoribosyltransferase